MKKRLMVVYLFVNILFTGCGGEKTEIVTSGGRVGMISQFWNEAENVEEIPSLPRNLSAYLWPELVWEMGGDLAPADFFDLETLEKEQQLTERDLKELFFQTEITEEMLTQAGRYQIAISDGDMVLSTHLKVQDTTPPVITLPELMEYCIGDTIFYKKGVSVTDNSGDELEVVIDNSKVYPNIEGI